VRLEPAPDLEPPWIVVAGQVEVHGASIGRGKEKLQQVLFPLYREPMAALTERQAARRGRVVQSAMKLAAEGGYDAVQMRDVANDAEVALGTLYRYFSSKDQLLVAVMAEWTRQLQRRASARPPEGDTPADRVFDVLARATRAMDRAPKLTNAVVTALSSLTSADPGGLEGARDVYGVINEIIGRAMANGDCEDQESVVRVIGQVWFATLIEWVRGWMDTKQMLDDLSTAVHLLLPDRKGASARRRTLSRA
jgi:AcrR family transcriptional regulator